MYRVVYFAILLFVVYTFFKRLAGYAISKLVQQRKLWITVDSIGFLVVRGIHIKLPKGPVAQVWITEISLGRTHSASKLVSGLTDGANGHTAGPKKRTSRFLTNSGLRLVLGILPSIPLRIKNIVITHPLTGILLEVPRIEVLIGCSRLSSKLQIDIHVQPILGTVKPKPVSKGQKSSSSGPPIVEIGEIKASTVLQVSRQATGLRCRSLAVERR
ncbi:hypothetical protein WJX72_002595 [[Myrmecia] bisecta]|uniref:Uncharacterized protein n=1 Tax=[Myrmecia] bisecta TaxID=41462 RepID=A0AAW1PCH8_9CHLO